MTEQSDQETKAYFLELLKKNRPTMQAEILEALASVGSEELKQQLEEKVKKRLPTAKADRTNKP